MPTVDLLTPIGDLVPGTKLMPTISEVFTGTEVRGVDEPAVVLKLEEVTSVVYMLVSVCR